MVTGVAEVVPGLTTLSKVIDPASEPATKGTSTLAPTGVALSATPAEAAPVPTELIPRNLIT